MRSLVLLAFSGTSIANFRAELAHSCREGTTASYEQRSEPTNRRTIAIKQYALAHHADVGFPEALRGAMVASGSAGIARFDTDVESFMGHGDSLRILSHVHASFQLLATSWRLIARGKPVAPKLPRHLGLSSRVLRLDTTGRRSHDPTTIQECSCR
jgi:hypothetical protein